MRAVQASATMRFMEHLHASSARSSSSPDGGGDEQQLFGEGKSEARTRNTEQKSLQKFPAMILDSAPPAHKFRLDQRGRREEEGAAVAVGSL